MTISSMPSKYLRCPTCHKTPDYGKVQNIIRDAMAYRDNRPFNPEDPVIISETEIYCSTECYAIAVLREERGKREGRERKGGGNKVMAKHEERTFSDGLEIGKEMIRSRYEQEETRKCGVKTYETQLKLKCPQS